MESIIFSEIQVLLMKCQFIVLALLWLLCPSYLDLHAFISVTGCSLHGIPSQITLEAIPVDVLCEIWEVLDNVEHLTCERVSDPHKVCHNCVVCDSWMYWGTVHYLIVTFERCYCLHNYTSEALATLKSYVSHVLSLPWSLCFLYMKERLAFVCVQRTLSTRLFHSPMLVSVER